jgi:hypothetical protein
VNSNHWILALIDLQAASILLLDPILDPSVQHTECLRRYEKLVLILRSLAACAQFEFSIANHDRIDAETFTVEFNPANLALQTDGTSCGSMILLYLLYFVQLQRLPTLDDLQDVSNSARRLAILNIFCSKCDENATVST